MDDLVRVYASGDHVAAQLMAARLESEGISVLRKGGGEGPYRAGPDYLFVSREDEVRARSVIDAVGSGAYALDEDAEVDVEPDEADSGDRADR
jgi:hypothetical protein